MRAAIATFVEWRAKASGNTVGETWPLYVTITRVTGACVVILDEDENFGVSEDPYMALATLLVLLRSLYSLRININICRGWRVTCSSHIEAGAVAH